MVEVQLADGRKLTMQAPATGEQAWGSLVKGDSMPVAYKQCGRLFDMSRPIEEGSAVEFVSADSEEGREVLRHTTAHVMAQAVCHLYPKTKLAIGPAISDGFYYDFDTDKTFSSEDLQAISDEMSRIATQNTPLRRVELGRQEALEHFRQKNQPYKVEMLEQMTDETVSLYRQDDFEDLCRGPHLLSTGCLGAFKLLEVAGAYWRGDERNPMLQRIYGTAFETQEALEQHLAKLQEAKERDHRKLGQQLDLFSSQEMIGAGLVLWHPNGGRLRTTIEDFWRQEHYRRGYELVYTPHIAKSDVWKTSGHLDFYREGMYSPMDIDGQDYYIKPMNCVGHILIYKSRLRSYRDLPIRLGELGTVYRYERSGALQGLLRVRGFTQDDAHLFCTPEQLLDEIVGVVNFVDFMMLERFGFKYRLYLSTRPEHSVGTDEDWARATEALKSALQKLGKTYEIDPGEGVFYGPKIDVKLIDALGREWQGPTIQVDFNEPERFDVTYVDKDGQRRRVVMIHRVVLGSMERFIGCLIEHYKGDFPLWLAPVQSVVLPVTDAVNDYAVLVKEHLRSVGLRVETDLRSEKIGQKIRDAELQKIPCMLVVGKREREANSVSLRRRKQGDLGSLTLDALRESMQREVDNPTVENQSEKGGESSLEDRSFQGAVSR
ncbi:MAG TPA: threonine--tRNA ligase [bacterium]|nr:threonine--tRNA ligase [bacterium]